MESAQEDLPRINLHALLDQKGWLLLSRTSSLKTALLDEFHNSPTGISKTYSRLNANVTWKGMKKDFIT